MRKQLATTIAILAAAIMFTAQTSRAQQEDEPDDESGMPPGHPNTGSAQQGRAQLPPGMFQPPPDTSNEDDKLPAGTIAITILDADNKPIPHATVNLGILHTSVAKGDRREHRSADANDVGALSFDHLETGTGIAYRVTVPREGATFAAAPLQLPAAKGMRVVLHAYDVTREMPQLVFAKGTIVVELKDDRVQIEQQITVLNVGRVAWLPDNVLISLPSNFTGFSAGQEMSDTGVDPVTDQGARLRGTFAPGRHDVQFRWQLPYADSESIEFDTGLPLNFVDLIVVAAATNQMKLEVPNFPAAVSRTDAQGGHFLITEKQFPPNEPPVRSVHIALRDLPTAGPASKIVTSLAGCIVVGGIVLAASTRRTKRSSTSRKSDRATLLAELGDLELAHRAGDVGPKTYESARRQIVDAIARTFA